MYVLCVFIKNNIITNGHVDSVVHHLSPACQVRTVLSIASEAQVRWSHCGRTRSVDCRNSARGGRCSYEDQACVRKMSAAPRTYCQQLVQEWSGCASPSRMHVRKQAGNGRCTIRMHGQKEVKVNLLLASFLQHTITTTHKDNEQVSFASQFHLWGIPSTIQASRDKAFRIRSCNTDITWDTRVSYTFAWYALTITFVWPLAVA